jgi:hypothetical protein
MTTTIELFDYVYDTEWGKMVYANIKDYVFKILFYEGKENYEKCAQLHRDTIEMLQIYSTYAEHYHINEEELYMLLHETYTTQIEFFRQQYQHNE